jgi:hypothetical protein
MFVSLTSMRRLFLPFLALSLAACHKQHGTRGLTQDTPSSALYMVAGQSNGRNLSAGYEAFRSVIPNAEFVNCAEGNTSMADWKVEGRVYRHCVDIVAGRPVRAIIFVQGENDAADKRAAGVWATNFVALARHLRDDFHAPIFYSRLGDFEFAGEPYKSTVRREQERANGNGATMVSIDGIAPWPANEHYPDKGYEEIAGRFAAVISEDL